MSTPERKILLIATVGGYTHAAPVIELGRVLADRGHTVDFATLEGQEQWEEDFMSTVHSIGPGPSEDDLEAHYLRMREWDAKKGFDDVMDSKYMFDSFWTQTYKFLKGIMEDETMRPDMIVADFFVDAVKDMQIEFNVSIAIIWPQMPFLMLPSSYIPGQPGFQIDMTLTSEHASIVSRIRNELVLFHSLGNIIKFKNWTKAMRAKVGVKHSIPITKKPNYLVLVNSFFGLETPKDLPPFAAAIGPILSDWYQLLVPSEPYLDFLDSHERTIYVALGTHIILKNEDAIKIIQGIMKAIDEDIIDGVIWAVGEGGRRDFDLDFIFLLDDLGDTITFGDLLNGAHPNWLFTEFAPQRGILGHRSTKAYLTHGGGSSANEGLYHGVPMIAMGIFFDQICNSARLVAGGSSLSIDKFTFTPLELRTKIGTLLTDRSITINSERLKRIARVASRRKHHGADLIEEYMYDTELRFDLDGTEMRPAHLQTADMRMSIWKANNWDLMAVVGLGLTSLVGGMWFVGKMIWVHRKMIRPALSRLGIFS